MYNVEKCPTHEILAVEKSFRIPFIAIGITDYHLTRR